MKNLPAQSSENMVTIEEEELAVRLSSRARRGDGRAVQLLVDLRQRIARRRLLVGSAESLADISAMQARVLEAVAFGIISPAEAAHVATILDLRGEAMMRADVEARVREMERELSAQKERPF